MKLYEFIDKDDNPTGIKKYIGPLFPIGDLYYYAPISNGFKYVTVKNNELQVSENTNGAIIIGYEGEFLGAIETDELVSSKEEPKEVKIEDIKDYEYRTLLEQIMKFVEENRIYIKQYAYANFNNKNDKK